MHPKTDDPLIAVELYDGDIVHVSSRWLTIEDSSWAFAYRLDGYMMGRVDRVGNRFFGRVILRRDIQRPLG